MTFSEFDAHLEKLFDSIRAMRDTKGKEYAHDGDRFSNFNKAALKNGVDRLVAANIFMGKHGDSLDSYIKNGGKIFSNESIHGRILDMLVYLCLIDGMITETELNELNDDKSV